MPAGQRVCDTSYKKRAEKKSRYAREKVDVQEKQPNRNREKAEYLDKNKVNE